jgi:hypothetical protein
MARAVPSQPSAREIYQDLLDRVALALETGDFDAYARMIHVPHEVTSYAPKLVIDTRSDLRVFFDTIRLDLSRRGITDYVRTCVSAEHIAPDEIVGVHETRMLSGTQVVEQPYPVKSHLRLIGGDWWVCSSDNAVGPDHGFGRVLTQNSSGSGNSSDPTLH